MSRPVVVLVVIVTFLTLVLASATPLAAGTKLLRFPDIHGDRVVFCHGGDLWRLDLQSGAVEEIAPYIGLVMALSPGETWTVGWSLRAEDAAAPVLGVTEPPLPTPRLDTTDQRLQRLAAGETGRDDRD